MTTELVKYQPPKYFVGQEVMAKLGGVYLAAKITNVTRGIYSNKWEYYVDLDNHGLYFTEDKLHVQGDIIEQETLQLSATEEPLDEIPF